MNEKEILFIVLVTDGKQTTSTTAKSMVCVCVCVIISRHRRSRICWTGDIIPACVVGIEHSEICK